MLSKKQLREQGIRALKKLANHPAQKTKKEQQILTLLFASQQWKTSDTIAVTKALAFEFDTEKVIQRALLQGKKVVVPKSLPERKLAFYEVDEDTDYQRTQFGVEEPISNLIVTKEEIELIVVPGLVFSSKGYRIGFGGGYYDRYLADYQGRTCSLVFAEQLNNEWMNEPLDVAVERIYTDSYKMKEATQ